MANISPFHRIIMVAMTSLIVSAGLLCELHVASAQSIYATTPEDQQFLEKTAQLDRALQMKNARRLSPLKSVNESYEKTQNALKLFDDPTSGDLVIELLTSAKKKYSGNYLASLFLGVYAYGHGNLKQAVPYFQEFMQRSLFPSKIERELINDEDTFYLRSFIENKLTSNGFLVEVPELPLEFKFKRGLQRLHVFPEESLLGAILAVTVLTGLVFIIFNSVFRVFDPTTTPLFVRQAMIRFYCLLVLAYVLWLVHLFFGIGPFGGGTLIREIALVIIIGTVGIMVHLFSISLKNRNKIRNDPDLIICPHCKHVQARINAVCIACNKKLN